MSDQETRLRLAEQKIEMHDKLHEETQEAIKSMATGIQQLALAETRREQDRETFSRVFTEIKGVQTEIKGVRTDFEDYKDDVTEKELAAAKSELDTQNKHIWDARSALLSGLGMLVLWIVAEKLGIHVGG